MKQVVLFAFFSLIALAASSQDQKRQNQFNIDKNLAISGYDPVAYFNQAKAVKGSAKYAVVYQGIQYYFSSVANKEEFKTNPAKYEPQYGGWCAYAMGATGEKVEIDPKTFKILHGKLYLFYNKYFNNTLTKWNKEEGSLKGKADHNWASFLH
jgi:YHS domain-containing protein